MILRKPCADCGKKLRGYEYLTPRGIICGECFRLTTCRPGTCGVPGCHGLFEGPGCLGDEKLSAKLALLEQITTQPEHRETRREMYEGLHRIRTSGSTAVDSIGLLPGYTNDRLPR